MLQNTKKLAPPRLFYRTLLRFAGLNGGRASDDAIRSLVIIYKLLGTKEFFVIQHGDCGMQFLTSDIMRGLIASSLETAALMPEAFTDVGSGPGSSASEFVEWLTIKERSHKSWTT